MTARIEARDLRPPLVEPAASPSASFQIIRDALGVAHRLTIVSLVASLDRNCARALHRPAGAGAGRPAASISSMTSIPCGPPKPRNAVCEVLCVRHTRPVDLHGRKLVRVVDVKHRPPHDRLRQDRGSIRRRRTAGPAAALMRPSLLEAGRVSREVRMTFAGNRDVEFAASGARGPDASSSTRRARRWPRTGWPAPPCPPNAPPIRRHSTVT